MVERGRITGVVLAGGRGARMGGLDKGLVDFRGAALVQWALERLAPQVGTVMISANRNLERYAGFGVPVVTDPQADFRGPLAGIAAALAACRSDWLACVPCDSPHFPLDLVERLAAAAAPLALARTRERRHGAFALLRHDEALPLEQYLEQGGRRVGEWADARQARWVSFDDEAAFANANTAEALRELGGG